MIKKSLRILGIMSGTSIDGIDISIVKSNGIKLTRNNFNVYFKHKKSYRKKISLICKNPFSVLNNPKLLNDLNTYVTKENFNAIKNIIIENKVDLIGFHGQTIYHNPSEKCTIQLGNPQMLANLTGIKVIFEFRNNDIYHGGQGAPLAPIYHRYLLEEIKAELPSCVLNIGGIANLTFWDGMNLIGFDTGPGNILMDTFFQEKFHKNFDTNGNFASLGIPKNKFINKFLSDKFFLAEYPKSLDREYFIKYLDYLKKQNLTDHDLMATLLEFTVFSIQHGILQLPKKPKLMMVTGGGYLNSYLLKRLKQKLKIELINSKNINFSTDFVESELIAYLAARSFNNLPITFPKTTGVNKPLCGGKIFFPKN